MYSSQKGRPSTALLLKSARLVNQKRIIYVRLGHDGLRALVHGDNDIYVVLYDPEKGVLKCTCPAGMRGKLCKHALAVKTYIDTKLYKSQPKPPSSTSQSESCSSHPAS